jgi:hypothetical protein
MERAFVVLFILAVLLVEPFAQHGLAKLSLQAQPPPCTCFGPRDTDLNIVYLHGLDTIAPSWMELQNRAKLHVIAKHLHARIALPRASGRWLHGSRIAESLGIIKEASSECFRRGNFVLLGFSDGANLVNELFVQCRSDVTSTFVAVGPSETIPRHSVDWSACGHFFLVAGRHEPGFSTNQAYAQQLARRGAKVQFIEHSGPHELPLKQLAILLRPHGQQ